MLKHLTLAALLASAVLPVAAHAQEDDDGPRVERRDRDEDRDRDRDRDRDEMRDGDREPEARDRRDMRHGDRWARSDERPGPRARGPEGRRGPPPPPPMAGFTIDMGPGRTVEVRCGDEAIAECVEAAQPILDALNTAGPSAAQVPPPPASLVEPAPGGTPPAPAN